MRTAKEQTRLDELAERNVALERENKILRDEIALLKRGRFGHSSERLDPGQLALFLGESGPIDPVSKVEVPAHERKKSNHGRGNFPEHLPRNVVELDVPEDERTCSCCGKALVAIGEDVSERGHITPARMSVNRYVRKKYACPDGHGVVTAAAPDGVVEGTKYEASVYAHVVTAKYCDHVPLNRLSGIFKRQGVNLPKQTIWDMLLRVDELVAQPVLKQMHRELLTESVLLADETPVKLRVEDGKGSRTGYAWCWRNVGEGDPTKVLVEFRASRGRDGPLGFLGDWSGTLLVDGYTGYDAAVVRNGIVRAGCWAHARRKLKDALDTGAREAAEVLVLVQRLFRVERAAKLRAERLALNLEDRVALRGRVRNARSRRIVEAIHALATDLTGRRATLPKSQLGKALRYLDGQREELEVFLDDARIPIHNNTTERDVRHLAVGRNNWLIFASQRGGEVGCRLYSLVLSCRHAGVDPQEYLEDVLSLISTTSASETATLTPWAWAASRTDRVSA